MEELLESTIKKDLHDQGEEQGERGDGHIRLVISRGGVRVTARQIDEAEFVQHDILVFCSTGDLEQIIFPLEHLYRRDFGKVLG